MLWEVSNNSNDTFRDKPWAKVTGCQNLIFWFMAESIILSRHIVKKTKEKIVTKHPYV